MTASLVLLMTGTGNNSTSACYPVTRGVNTCGPAPSPPRPPYPLRPTVAMVPSDQAPDQCMVQVHRHVHGVLSKHLPQQGAPLDVCMKHGQGRSIMRSELSWLFRKEPLGVSASSP